MHVALSLKSVERYQAIVMKCSIILLAEWSSRPSLFSEEVHEYFASEQAAAVLSRMCAWLVQLPRLVSQRQLETEMDRLRLGHPKAGNELHVSAPLDNAHLQTLLMWAATICAAYGLSVVNCSSSFANGKALCLLVSTLNL